MGALLDIAGIRKTTEGFRSQVVKQARESHLDPNNVAAVISLESGFDPTVMNGKHAGLIQFYEKYFPPIAERAGMDVLWSELPQLTAEEQLPLVITWFRLHGITTDNPPADYLLSVFMPGQMGRPSDAVIAREGSTEYVPGTQLFEGTVYAQNRSYDTNMDGEITIADLEEKIEGVLEKARARGVLGAASSSTDWGWLLGGVLLFGGLGFAVSHQRR